MTHSQTASRAALIAFLVGSLLAALTVGWQAHSNNQTRETQFSALAQSVADQVVLHMRRYEYGLRGARGAVIAADPAHITRQSFRRYAESRDIDAEFPGARGFGFIRRVPEVDEPAFTAAARRDGAPGLHVHQLAAHAGERFVIQYIEPAERNAAAIGLDIASEPNRRQAALRAMHENRAILTGPITLVQARGKAHQSFLLLLPLYRHGAALDAPAARDEAALGWVYAPMSAQEVLADLIDGPALYSLSLRDRTAGAADAQPVAFFDDARTTEPAAAGLVRHLPLNVYGRTWEAEIRATPQFVASLALRSPQQVAVEAALAVALLTAVAWYYGLAMSRTRLLDTEQARRAAMVDSSLDAIISVDLDGRITSWNPAAQQIFGHTPAQAIGQSLDQLLVPHSRSHESEDVLAHIRTGNAVPAYDTLRLARDGRELDVAISVSPLRDHAGRVVGMAKTLRDITTAKAAERRLQQFAAQLEQQVAERTVALQATQRDLRNILDALPSMIGYWDHELRNGFANRAYKSWFGDRADDLTGKNMIELLGAELYERNRPHVEAALRGEPQTFERSIPTPDGTGMRHALAHYLPDIVDGEVRGFYVLVHDVTELTESRRFAAAAQRDNEFLLQTIHKHSIVSVADRAGRITDVNEAFCKISGYTRAELLGQNHRIVNSGTHTPEFWPEVWRSISTGKAWRGEICNRAKDGSLYWVDSIIAPFVTTEGQIDRYISIRFDITDRKRAATALNATLERLALATDAAAIGVWEYDLPSNTLRWDDWMYRLYGQAHNADEAPYTLWADQLHPDDKAASEQALQACIDGERDFNIDFRIRWPDGQVRYIRAAAKAHRDASGRAVRLIGVNWDITKWRAAELELAQTTSLLRTVLASASEVSIIATDPDFVIRVFNHGAERMLGYSSAEVIGLATPGLIHDADEIRQRAAELSAALGKPVRGGAYFREAATHGVPREWSYRRKDGSLVLVSLVVTAMHTDDGHLLGYLGVAHDISEQKRHEQLLIERSAAAEQANLAKSQFLANMSHEIRTPMNAVVGLSFLLEQTRLDSQQSDLLAKMTRASKTLLGVINDVLDLSKIEAGELGVSIEPFALAALVRYVTDVMQVQADIKGLAISLEVAALLPPLLNGDSLRVNQVLSNLLSNAIKFTDKGGVHLRVLALDAPPNSMRLRFEVQDTGIGISAEAAKGLFQPFAQADSSITRRFGGTGLGLSIVKQLAELMGGAAGFSSELGVGSRFWVDLPFGLVDEATARLHVKQVDTTGRPSLQGMRVLVVDDSSINQEVAKRILETAGAEVALCDDGQAAVDYLREHADACDVVLMDVHMPVLDGLNATRVIRQELGLRELPIVALTAGALASQRQEAHFVGMNDFIVKPFSPNKVINCIARYARPTAGGAAPRGATTYPVTALADWPAITGIANAAVVRQLGGDLGLFRTLLGYLLKEFSAVPSPDGTAEELQALAARLHKLRGGAGNVGAQGVHEIATLAEQACRTGDVPAARGAITTLNQRLVELAASATAWLQQTAPAQDSVPAQDTASLAEADLDDLAALLRQQHIDAIERFEALAPRLRARFGSERFDQLREHVEQLQFAAAASLLARND